MPNINVLTHPSVIEGAKLYGETSNGTPGYFDADYLLNRIKSLQSDLINISIPAVDKILATTANLVDVFVYNTYKDYDGGKWTEQANYQSWYIEQLNTATRGSKREFPKVALIVAETNKVTIYDATETDCPMWIVFEVSALTWATLAKLVNAQTVSAVSAINSKIAITGLLGLYVVDFTKDDGFGYRQTVSQGFGVFNGGIASRNTSLGYTTTVTGTWVAHDICNDVAMTTISRTENAYGLLDPVIAVATDGGVSVIDGPAGAGTVVDSALTTSAKQIAFSDSYLYWSHGTTASYLTRSASTITDILADGFTAIQYSNATPAINPTSQATNALSISGDSVSMGKAAQLTKLSENTATPANGMVAYITNSYNTGWLKGYVMRAMICEAEGTTETLTNLVTNGTFDSDTAWTKGTGWTISGGTANGVAGTGSYLSQTISAVIGKKYRITANATISAGALSITFGGVSTTDITTTSSVDQIITATSTGNLLIFKNATFAGSIDNVIVTEVIPDRSVKASSLTVNGSLTRSPVAAGAELQGISGFSTSNYLSQAYSADLDFGTGDFYAKFWIKENPNSVEETVFERAYWNGSSVSGAAIRVNVSSGGLLNCSITDDAFATSDSASSIDVIDDSTWKFGVIQKVGSKLQVFINSVQKSDITIVNATASLSNASATLRVGLRNQGNVALTNGTLALLRIGSGSLSAAQIAKMYREELALFQPGAKCTIQGASSAVTALSYNERYNKLLVGTSAGVTCFDNLAVDESFYTNTGSIKALASDNKINLAASTAEVKVKK